MGKLNALNRKIERQRDKVAVLEGGKIFLAIAMLAYDDLEGINEEKTSMFVNACSELITGYANCGAKNPKDAIMAELADRGIEFCFDGVTSVGPTPNPHQRGIGVWIECEKKVNIGVDENGEPKFVRKKYYQCSHCKKGSVVRDEYCRKCGADMRKKDENNNT